MDETRELVDFSVGLRYEDLPAVVVERAKLCVLDIVGVALFGGKQIAGQAVAEFVKDSGGRAESVVWGTGWRTSAQYAALVNGTGAHGIEMDDWHAALELHCGASVVPGAIAAAEKAQAKGKDLIVAVVLGYEIAYRIARVLFGFQIMQREIKPYAAWGGSHASIDAANEMMKTYKVKPEQIESIEIGGSFKMLDMHEGKRPQSLMAAQYSLPFVTALAFFQNLADPSVWDDEVLNRPEVLALAQKVDLRLDEELEKIRQQTNDYAGIKMTVRLKNGREHRAQVRYSKGTLENPATSNDIHEKFKVMASHVFPAARVEETAGLIDRLDEMDSVISLGKVLTWPPE